MIKNRTAKNINKNQTLETISLLQLDMHWNKNTKTEEHKLLVNIEANDHRIYFQLTTYITVHLQKEKTKKKKKEEKFFLFSDLLYAMKL